MKKLTKIKTISLSLLCVLALAACNSSSDTNSEESKTSEEKTSATSQSEATSSAESKTSEATSSQSSSSGAPEIDEDSGITITTAKGANECAYVEFEVESSDLTSSYTVSYSTDNTNYTDIDNELLSKSDTKIRADIVGLKPGSYNIKVSNNTTAAYSIKTVTVVAFDRSGYAHFNNTTGVGAYNNDGTLKANTQIVYVSDETKNTVQAKIGGTTYTGLVAILQAQKNSSNPLDIRIIDSIKTNQYKSKSNEPRLTDNSNLQEDTFFDNELETTYGDNLIGLTVQYMDKYQGKSYKHTTTLSGLTLTSTGSSSVETTTYNGSEYASIKGKKVYDDDSYFNMLDISNVKNVTVEGIGLNAEIFQWGFTWKKCNSIEIRNLTFTDYTEDACSFEGSDSVDTYKNFWVHNNTFNKGKNNWDISGERDKYAGDGAMDLKVLSNVTASYNRFNNCKKTGLVGGGDTVLDKNITFHHNYYNKVGSRLPLGRQANMHIYNNYYQNCTTCQDIRANAFVLSEYNYFESCANCHLVTQEDPYKYAVIKSYNNFLTGGVDKSTIVTDRTQTLSGSCKPDGSTDYTNFDVNTNYFYYDKYSKCSDVEIMNNVDDLPILIPTVAGSGAGYYTAVERESENELIALKQSKINDLNSLIKSGGTYYNIYQTKKGECDALITKYTTLINEAKKSSAVNSLYDEAIAEFKNLTKTSYTITFMVDNVEYETVTAYENEKVTFPTSPTKTDEYFSYWADSSNNRFTGIATESTTLHAVFESVLTYSDLASDSNNVIATDFNSTTANEKLTDMDLTKAQAFGTTNGSDTSLCYGIYTGNAIQTVDNDSDAASVIGYTFGEEYTSGIIKGYVTITIGEKTGSKWKLIGFYDSEGNEQVAFGLDSNKNWSYMIDGTTWVAFDTSLTATANTTYNLYYQIDLNTGLVTLYINDVLYINGLSTNATAISYFQTMTNGSGTGDSSRVVTLDNIAIVKED
ncbi:MAG: hypothetical protein K6E20_02650 [Acholeplasmatales bacterium]|nr:hypothetical protein [Acholeplasmatales bacterium]